MSTQAQKFSFTFSKQKKPLLQTCAAAQKREPPTAKKEYITSIEDNVIHSSNPSPSPLVIPLIHSKHGIRSRMQAIKRSVSALPPDALTQQALNELKAEAVGTEGDNSNTPGSIPVNLPNAFTEPDASEEANYDAVPVESFGLAALTGMGFNPEELKSAVGQPVGPIRPKGLGLGADPRVLQPPKPDEKDDSKKKLEWIPGARVQAVLGKHKGRYGTINGMDGDTGRVIVKFTISKEIVPILQPMLRLVHEKEYNTYANCLNQAQVDRYKAEEENNQQHPSDPSHKPYTTYNGHSHGEKRHRREPDSYSPPYKRNYSSKSQDPYSWVRPKLLVTLLDKHILSGKYYKQKVTIVSIDSGLCDCVTGSGKLLQGIHPKYLKTVLPDHNNSMVMVLHGPRSGEMAKLMERHPETNEVDLRTRAGTMISLSCDQVCMVSD